MNHTPELRRRALFWPFVRGIDIQPDAHMAFDAKRGITLGLSINKLLDVMGGRPVWSASVSFRHPKHGTIIPTSTWGEERTKKARALIRGMLQDVGDRQLERGLRTFATMVCWRAITRAEEDQLPAGFREAQPLDPPFGILELLWSTPAAPPHLSLEPCRDVQIGMVDQRTGEELEVVECGECDTCLARSESVRQARTWQPLVLLTDSAGGRGGGLLDASGNPLTPSHPWRPTTS